MRWIIFGLLVLVSTTVFAQTKNKYGNKQFYSKTGSYEGRISKSGSIYSKNGSYQGRIDAHGKYFNKNGSFQGRIK